ncbi:Eco57I restriction-modification methylase domain-containing protein [Polynucleobacter paneuropaeus]|uniref:site-specific DNA-methyltransferase (adenine-specific) n=1 Tax=Polynucleobacter paneuropaeus TaxID=2527775 RepID=A0A2Z4JUK1_9BURK|nr:Eco57I restriction-modification methylase domain-containing protein [Polynucleobacter paneuropaeus]AWW50568.1 restriction endonuclease [Polynucleobacter paneuropaeus]
MSVNTTYNPDVLTCIANLSNDEVFTPPVLANQILDLLPLSLWKSTETTFLDPVSKTGVFLREIVKRLDVGLAKVIPDKEKRINHILTNQVFGIAITELTSLLSRRSLYCSKNANGKYSLVNRFKNVEGNIKFDRVEHVWKNNKCTFCGASIEVHNRGSELETHAYQFIHTESPEEIFDMKFDVIVGNPPYQLNDGGFGKSASPLYHKFIEQAIKLNPRFISMIVPSRWFAGGKGLDEFRNSMLNDNRLSHLIDFPNASDCFPGVDIAGGICYFLWSRDHAGDCEVTTINSGLTTKSTRSLNEFNTLIRDSNAISIIRKVNQKKDLSLSKQVSSRKPFGLSTNIRPTKTGDLILRWNGGEGPFKKSEITTGFELINKWKVITSKVSYDHAGQPDKQGMRKVLSIVDVLPPDYVCTETYLVAGAFDNKEEAENLASYLKTKFVRFLVAQMSFSQDITKDRFLFAPSLSMKKKWSEKDLYERYGLTKDEITHISNKIKPMED